MKKKKGFTLIELIAVLVIMAIITLIVTPLVMSVIKKAKVSADKRSIDAYGRSIELAVAGYLMDTGTFPTSMEQLTIEYTGEEVVCSTTKLNNDSSVYLAGCTVGGRSVEGYTYGSEEVITYEAYSVGDEVTYNNIDYYVIKDSDTSEQSVILLKAEPLTVSEVNQYGVGHLNRYTRDSVGTAYNKNGYGGMAYYSSETCGYLNNKWIDNGCTTDYAQSEIKYVVDAWKDVQAPAASEARLMMYDEYFMNCEEEEYQSTPSDIGKRYVSKYDWMYNNNYFYWMNTSYQDSPLYVSTVTAIGTMDYSGVDGYNGDLEVVRPVITLSKTALD